MYKNEQTVRDSISKGIEVNWEGISLYQNLSEDFIREFQYRVHWRNISEYQTLSEDFIREFKYKVNWDKISVYQTLSEDFIREFKTVVNWDKISFSQTLSEDFIRKFKAKVNWDNISIYQKLSEDFIKEFQDKITFSRPNITFNRDIAHCSPCESDVEIYQSDIDGDEEISWNTLLKYYSNKSDIYWLANNIKGREYTNE